MIRHLAIVREAAGRIAEAVDHVVGALAETRIEQEAAFTDRMLGAIELTMKGFASRGVRWTAKTLTDRGPRAQETHIGADFAGVFSARLSDSPEFNVSKGFLAQAKLIRPGRSDVRAEFERLRAQCDRMLSVSPASFVFLYADWGVTVVPAVSIWSSEPRDIFDFYSRGIARFFEEHFESFIGDRRLYAPTRNVLEGLLSEANPRRVLLLEVNTTE
jgi:hypothetical protein